MQEQDKRKLARQIKEKIETTKSPTLRKTEMKSMRSQFIKKYTSNNKFYESKDLKSEEEKRNSNANRSQWLAQAKIK